MLGKPMGSKAVALLHMAFFSACGSPELPGQEEAVRIVWEDTYKATRSPPYITWVRQDELNCHPDANGQFQGYLSPTKDKPDRCLGGLTWVQLSRCYVALPDGYPYSRTALAHELYHQYLYYEDRPTGHEDPGFGMDSGHPWGIVDEAKAALAKAGL